MHLIRGIFRQWKTTSRYVRSNVLSLSPRVTPLKAGLYEWLNLFARPFFLKDMLAKEAEAILHEVVGMCRRDCQDESGKWAMVYMRLRFCATLKD